MSLELSFHPMWLIQIQSARDVLLAKCKQWHHALSMSHVMSNMHKQLPPA